MKGEVWFIILLGKSNLISDYIKMVGVKCFVHPIKFIDDIISYYTILYRLHIYDVHLIIKDVFSVTMLNIDFVKKKTITAKLFRRILKYRIILNMFVNAHHTHSVFLQIFIHFFLLWYLFSIGYQNMDMMRYLTLFIAWFGR